ncbi:MAG: proline iminopeptidase-family hydrolase [Hymenobacter sp.]
MSMKKHVVDRHLLAVVCFWMLAALALSAQPVRKATEGFIAVPGGKVWYQILGADKPGVPLLLLHGGPGSSSSSFAGFAALADERPVILYDQLGCGKSDRPTDTSLWTLARFVDEVDVVVKTLNYPKLHLLGHSWGTALATEYLLRKKPPSVVSLIQSSPFLDTPRWVADADRYIAQLPPASQAALRHYDAKDPVGQQAYQAAVALYSRQHLYRNGPLPPNKANFGTPVYETMWGPDEAQCTGNLRHYSSVARLKDLPVPSLYLCGRYDEATPASTAYFQQLTPNSRLVVFEKASHKAYMEVPDEYFRTVRGFLHRF